MAINYDTENICWDWRDNGSAVMSTRSSSRGFKFNSNTHMVAHNPLAVRFQELWLPLLASLALNTHGTQTSLQSNSYSHKKKIKNVFKSVYTHLVIFSLFWQSTISVNCSIMIWKTEMSVNSTTVLSKPTSVLELVKNALPRDHDVQISPQPSFP